MTTEQTTMNDYKAIMVSGLIGLLAAILVGFGEFLLHFDALARYSETHYDFMLSISDQQQTLGHFFGALGAPLYVVGCWHFYLMLKPANKKLAFIGFIIGAYGFMVGASWISSRASIGALTHAQDLGLNLDNLVVLYQLRYETLLNVVRLTTLLLSLIFVYLTLTGRSNYNKWHALFNPIVLLLLSFIVYLISPDIGKYLMPIALNIGYGLFFIISLAHARKINAR